MQALATADISIAIGSGSEVTILSASFILLSSSLSSFLTLTDLSGKVLSRVKLNFVYPHHVLENCLETMMLYLQLWALLYNLVTVPIAIGVLYPIGHVQLAPAWASLAMALS